jgi:hypothetical protein
VSGRPLYPRPAAVLGSTACRWVLSVAAFLSPPRSLHDVPGAWRGAIPARRLQACHARTH